MRAQGNVKMSRMPTYRKDDTLRFLNARKRLPVATERTAASFAAAALKLGYGSAVVKMRGPGPHKQLAVQVGNHAMHRTWRRRRFRWSAHCRDTHL